MLHYMKPLETTEMTMGGSFVKLSFVPLKEGMTCLLIVTKQG